LLLLLIAAWLQTSVLPGLCERGWRPEAGLFLGLAALAPLAALGQADAALYLFFALGLEADVLGSAHLGLCTLCYTLTGALLLESGLLRERRVFVRGLWLALGVGSAQFGYAILGQFFGIPETFGLALWDALRQTLLALLLGWAVMLTFDLCSAWVLPREAW
jgi:hypothetical protein